MSISCKRNYSEFTLNISVKLQENQKTFEVTYEIDREAIEENIVYVRSESYQFLKRVARKFVKLLDIFFNFSGFVDT